MSQITEKVLKEEIDKLFIPNNDKIHKINMTTKKTKLILSGGGMKGIAHLGAIKALEELEMMKYIDTYCGTSVGAMISALLCVGYTADELFSFISMMDMSKVKCLSFNNLLKLFGLDDGKKMEIVFEKMFKAKGIPANITFKQLFDRTKKILIITVSCLNDKKVYYHSYQTVPDMQVLTAVRMSISIPIYFAPVKYQGKMYVDGGCMDNYPIQLFSDCLDEVVGLCLADIKDNVNDITNIEDLLLHIIQCLFEGVTHYSLKGYEKYSIKISLDKVSVVDFHMDNETKQKLFDIGYKTVMNNV